MVIQRKKRGQVWIETVIYTLIGLVIIGLVLSVAKPKIDAKKSEILIEQAIESLGNINEKIKVIESSPPGNRRSIELEVGSGRINIDSENDKIVWILDSDLLFSELGVQVGVGDALITTTKGEPYTVTIEASHNSDIEFDGQTTGIRAIEASPTPYRLIIENSGKNAAGNIIATLRLV